MNYYYAGIGSRETPDDVIKMFENMAASLANKGFILRSGHADGADAAFERGCDRVGGAKEIYVPWNGFNGSKSSLIVKDGEAFNMAKEYHPYWQNLKEGAKKLQARNSHQMFGWDLKTPSNFVLCWTKNGKGSGGTGQAIRIAKAYNIPVFDAGGYEDLKDYCNDVINFIYGEFKNELSDVFG